MTSLTHVFIWGNNSKRETLQNRKCRILVYGKKRSVLVEFENGQKECVDLFALRRIKDKAAVQRKQRNGSLRGSIFFSYSGTKFVPTLTLITEYGTQ